MEHHPDRPTGNAEKFKEIGCAYEILSDPEKKRAYDMQRKNPFAAAMGAGGGMPFMGAPDDLFKMLFSMGGGRGRMPFDMGGGNAQFFVNGMPMNMNMMSKPTPIIKTITITFTEAFKGITYPMEIERWIKNKDTRYTEKEKIYVDIPCGIDTNEIIIIRGKGNILNDTNKGDIKIFIKIENNTSFERKGLDLIYTQMISLKEALTGFQFDMSYLDGKVYTINNTAGKIIVPSYKKQIPQMGMQRGERRGNLLIHFRIDFPSSLSEEQKTQLKTIL
jgi:DnaJ-class molecular chaperone